MAGLDPSIAGRRLFAFGDSHTAAYRTMLTIVSSELDIERFEYERGDSAVAGLLKPLAERDDWAAYYEESLEDIKSKARRGDVVFLASLRMPAFSDRFEVPDLGAILDEVSFSGCCRRQAGRPG